MNNFLITLSLCMAGFASGQIEAHEKCGLTPHELQQVLGVDSLMLRADLKKGQKLTFSYVEYDADLQKVVKTILADMPLAGQWGFAKNGPATVVYKLVLHEETISILYNGIQSNAKMGLPVDWAKEIMTEFQVLNPSLISLKRMSLNKGGRFILSNIYLCLKVDVINGEE